jgi:hypothetical protein
MQSAGEGRSQLIGQQRFVVGEQRRRDMHLEGTSTGAMLTFGKDEIIIRMAQ